ncbi:MAG: ABC transporter substrate-binding protein [Lachnospiraceae bacterium]|nr:ABC transporter substrate-binding protein [Lachnospiraceae bacterium]
MKRKLSLVLAAVMVAGSLAACGGSSQPAATTAAPAATEATAAETEAAAAETEAAAAETEAAAPEAGGFKDTIKFARPADPADLDPTIGDDTYSTRMYHSIIPGLVQVDANGEIVPDLAESWEVSEDGLTWTFHLRPGLKFADGSDVTIEDWQFSFDRAKNTEESYWKYTAEPIVSVEGDNETVIITIAEENPAFLAYLTLFNMGLQSKAHFDELGGTYDGGWPLGAGAYYVTEWAHDQYVALDANPYYYKEGYPKTPHVRFETVGEDNSRTMMLQGGEIDIMSDLPFSSAAVTDAADGVSVVEWPSTQQRYLVLNNEANPAFADVKVRQALMMGTDFQQLIDMCLYGFGQKSNSFLSPKQLGYNTSLPEYTYDVEGAKALLAEAGYPDGFDVTFTLRAGNALFEQIGTIIQDQWSKIGVRVNIESMDNAALRELQNEMKLEMVIGTWTDDMPDPSQLTQYLLDYETNHGFYTNWKSDACNELFAEASKEMDDAKRYELYNQIQEICHDEVALPSLFNANEIVAQRDALTGFVQTPYGQYILEDVTVAE